MAEGGSDGFPEGVGFWVLIILVIANGTFLNADTAEEAPADAFTVLAEDGGWGYAGPHAVAADGKLFFSYLDQAGGKWVASHDLESGEIVRNALGEGDTDLHSANPLLVRPDGHVQVFLDDQGGYAAHGIYWKVSTRPYDVGEFGELKRSDIDADILQGRQFYPMAVESTNEVYVVTNALRDDHVRETVMWRSRDGGDTFAEHYRLWSLAEGLAGNRSYTRSFVRGDDIHFVAVRVGWNEPLDGHSIGRSEGVYYIRFNVTDETFYRASGERAFDLEDVPVYDADLFDSVWHWTEHGDSTQRALWSDLVADADGRPYIALAVQDAVAEGESTLHEGYWATPDESGQWQTHRVTTLARGWDNTPERKNYAIAINPQAPEQVVVARSTDAGRDLSQVHRMTSPDGGRTWQSIATLSKEDRITTVIAPRVLDASVAGIEPIWLQGRMEGWRDYATSIVTPAKADAP